MAGLLSGISIEKKKEIKTVVNGEGDCRGHLTDYRLTVTQMMTKGNPVCGWVVE